MTRHLLVGCCAALAVAGLAARAPAQPAVPLPLYRIVLTDGTSVDAYGEWVRVGDRVVFSLALDPQRDPPALRLSSVPGICFQSEGILSRHIKTTCIRS